MNIREKWTLTSLNLFIHLFEVNPFLREKEVGLFIFSILEMRSSMFISIIRRVLKSTIYWFPLSPILPIMNFVLFRLLLWPQQSVINKGGDFGPHITLF